MRSTGADESLGAGVWRRLGREIQGAQGRFCEKYGVHTAISGGIDYVCGPAAEGWIYMGELCLCEILWKRVYYVGGKAVNAWSTYKLK